MHCFIQDDSLNEATTLAVPGCVSKSSSDNSLVSKASSRIGKVANYCRDLKVANYCRDLKAKRTLSPRQRLDELADDRINKSKEMYADCETSIIVF